MADNMANIELADTNKNIFFYENAIKVNIW